MIQSRGTGRVGMLFGPVMVVWFITIGVLGVPLDSAGAAGAGGLQPAARA